MFGEIIHEETSLFRRSNLLENFRYKYMKINSVVGATVMVGVFGRSNAKNDTRWQASLIHADDFDRCIHFG